MRYESYLERVKEHYPDEFTEVSNIIARYQTLCKENEKLVNSCKQKEEAYQKLKQSTSQFVKDKATEIMRLNNDISTKKTELERIEEEKAQLKAESEEVNSKKLGKISELA